ncbi:GYD domain-containing protein [Ostreiculturibacter nitratireducens]|uniref:GYD domain-containing protein n=1 Tax=Ostreiculturibacter nitratireducens TaxID=3075226 RepID=UPI0031B58804
MPRFIVTGCYTASAMKGLMENPSDREAAARKLVEAAGGKLESFYMTTGPSDFTMKIVIDDVSSLLAGLMVAASTGAISNVQTIRAFTSDEFTAIQKKAASLAAQYSAPA